MVLLYKYSHKGLFYLTERGVFLRKGKQTFFPQSLLRCFLGWWRGFTVILPTGSCSKTINQLISQRIARLNEPYENKVAISYSFLYMSESQWGHLVTVGKLVPLVI